MSTDKQLQKVLNIWLSTFEATKGKLSDKQIQNFLQTKEAKELSNFPENVVIESMEYAYSINTSKLKDIYDIAVNEHFKPKIAKIIKVDADKIDKQNKEKNKEKQQDIYSSAFKQFFGKSISEDIAKEILDYFDMADWVKYWKGGEVEKTKCGGGSCGIDSSGNLKKIYKFSKLAEKYKNKNQYIYRCDLNLGFHIATFIDAFGDKMSIRDLELIGTPNNTQDFEVIDIDQNIEVEDYFRDLIVDQGILEMVKQLSPNSIESISNNNADKILYEILNNLTLTLEGKSFDEVLNENAKNSESVPEFLIQDTSNVCLDEKGEIILSEEGYPIYKIHYEEHIRLTNTIKNVWDIEPLKPDVIIENSYKKIKVTDNVDLIDESMHDWKRVTLEKNGEFAINKNGDALHSYPKVDKEGYITLDENDCIVFTEFR